MRRAGAQQHPSRDSDEAALGGYLCEGTGMTEDVQALLFDLGRVVLDLDVERVHARWAELAGVPVDEVALRYPEIIGSEFFRQHERGEISDAAFFEHVRLVLDVELSDDQLLDGWNAMFVGEVAGIGAVLSEIQDVLPLYAFSNTNAAHIAWLSAQLPDLLRPFRKVYVSHEIRARKPEPAAFAMVVADIGLAPERVLFFDDLAENVNGARAAGLRAVHVTTTQDVARALAGIRLGG
jgi:glucose-1-phosphatase